MKGIKKSDNQTRLPDLSLLKDKFYSATSSSDSGDSSTIGVGS